MDTAQRQKKKEDALRWGWLILANALFATCLLPYVSPLPLGGDLQPMMGVLALLVLGYHVIVQRRRVALDLYVFTLGACAIVFFFYYDWQSAGGSMQSVKKLAGVPLGFVIFLAIRCSMGALSPWVPVATLSLEATASVLQVTLPHGYEALQSAFLGRSPTAFEVSGRITGLTPEPSFLAISAILSLIALLALHHHGQRLPFWPRMAAVFLGIALVLLSKAGSGIVLGVAALGMWLALYGHWRFLLAGAVCGAAGIAFVLLSTQGPTPAFPEPRTRTVTLLRQAMLEPRYLLNDVSILTRVCDPALGMLSILENPWGTRRIEYGNYAVKLADQHDLLADVPEGPRQAYYANLMRGGCSDFGRHAMRMGAPFLGCFVIIIIPLFFSRVGWVSASVLLPGMLMSFSFAFPMIWFFVAWCSREPSFEKRIPLPK